MLTTISAQAPETLAKIADGSHPFLKKLEGAERPMLILGQGALARARRCGDAWRSPPRPRSLWARSSPHLAWNGFNVLAHGRRRASAGLDLGFVPGQGRPRRRRRCSTRPATARSKSSICSAPTRSTWSAWAKRFVIYQGSHGDKGAHRADVILPGAAYTEKDGTYVNTEGRAQMTARAVFPPGEAREDWTILRALSAVLGKPLPFDTTQQLRAKMYEAHPHLALLDLIDPADAGAIERLAKKQAKARQGALRPRGRRLLSHQPDRARLGRHGEFERAAFRLRRQGDRHRWLSSGRAMACRSRSIVVQSVAILVTLLIIVAFLLYADRKVWAAVQMRRGPNVVGPWGLWQSFADLLKFVLKEPVIPAGANKGIFLLAPLVTAGLALVRVGGDPRRRAAGRWPISMSASCSSSPSRAFRSTA